MLLWTLWTLGTLCTLAACAPTTGWQRTDRRTCDSEATPILCMTAAPEGPYELRVGGQVVLPGECIEAPDGARGGSVPVASFRSGAEVARRRVGVRRGVRTSVRIDERRLEVAHRRRCDQSIPASAPPPS